MANVQARAGHVGLVTIYEISKVLGSSLDLSKTMREVMNILATHLEIWRGMLVLAEDGDVLRLAAATGLSVEEYERGRYHSDEGVIGAVYRSGHPVVVSDVAREPLYLDRTGAIDAADGAHVAFIGVPVKAGREVLGVLAIEHKVPEATRMFDEDVRFLTMVANLVGQTVRLHDKVVSERTQLLSENRRLQRDLQGKHSLENVIGVSKAMQAVFAEVHQSAPSRATVLLRGESGVGKEVIARALHFLSPRKDGPFIKVNCAALTETLLESELFGHERGAFTGAQGERKGRFELAHGGTLFLDEIGDISPAFQAKLLRVLQEREFERVGGNRSIRVDVRLITATNRDLERAVSKGEFRADLYYRINVVSIFIPPLRERRDDIPYLVEYFLDKFNRENQRNLTIDRSAIEVLLKCYWPGNVRELENCIERTATMVRGNVIREVNFACAQNKCLTQSLHEFPSGPRVIATSVAPMEPGGNAVAVVVRDVRAPATRAPEAETSEPPSTERERLVWAMERSGWVQARAARLLNITARQLGYALQKHNIEVKKF